MTISEHTDPDAMLDEIERHGMRAMTPEVRGALVEVTIQQITELTAGMIALRKAEDRLVAAGSPPMPREARERLDALLSSIDEQENAKAS